MSSTQSESQPQRSVSNFISSIPIVTKTLLLLNCSVYLLSTVLGRSTQADALSPAAALPPNYELTRMITYAFVHMSFLHLLMNMVTLWQLGTSLEQQFGSMPFIFLTGKWFRQTTSVIHVEATIYMLISIPYILYVV